MLFGSAVSVCSDDDRPRLNTARRRRWSSKQNCAILALLLDQRDGKRTDPWDGGTVGLFRSVALDWPHSMSQPSHPTTGENVTSGMRCSIRVTSAKVLPYIYNEQQSFPWTLNRVQCSERVSVSTVHRHWWSTTIVRANSSHWVKTLSPTCNQSNWANGPNIEESRNSMTIHWAIFETHFIGIIFEDHFLHLETNRHFFVQLLNSMLTDTSNRFLENILREIGVSIGFQVYQ